MTIIWYQTATDMLNAKRTRSTNCTAFTLTELLVVIVIITFLMSLSIVGVQRVNRPGALEASNSVKTSIKLARAQALTLNTYARIGFSVSPERPNSIAAGIFVSKTGENSSISSDWKLAQSLLYLESMTFAQSSLSGVGNIASNDLPTLTKTIGGKSFSFGNGVVFRPNGVGVASASGTVNRYLACSLSNQKVADQEAQILFSTLSGNVEVISP
ncbi:MAG: prepilin-type N-terminal cleavage/methylation domain-containing protein [Verrucomicrobiota bacterium]